MSDAPDYTNADTAKGLTLDQAQDALLRIATILDGEKDYPGKEWTSDEVEWVAAVITGLGFTIREPGEEYAGYEEDAEEDEDEGREGHESTSGPIGNVTYCDRTCKGPRRG